MTLELPNATTPEALAEHMGWSPRRVRKLARGLGACRIMGNRMSLLDEDVAAILASQGAEAELLTFPSAPAPAPPPKAHPTIHGPKQGYIYFVERNGFVKIGYSTDPRGRISNLQVSSPEPIAALKIMPGTEQDERDLHRRFSALRARGEWFRLESELKEWVDRWCRQ